MAQCTSDIKLSNQVPSFNTADAMVTTMRRALRKGTYGFTEVFTGLKVLI